MKIGIIVKNEEAAIGLLNHTASAIGNIPDLPSKSVYLPELASWLYFIPKDEVWASDIAGFDFVLEDARIRRIL